LKVFGHVVTWSLLCGGQRRLFGRLGDGSNVDDACDVFATQRALLQLRTAGIAHTQMAALEHHLPIETTSVCVSEAAHRWREGSKSRKQYRIGYAIEAHDARAVF
jgi:hypothetical protein